MDQDLANNRRSLTLIVDEQSAVTATPMPTPAPTATMTPPPDKTTVTVAAGAGGELRYTYPDGKRVTVQILRNSIEETTTFHLQTPEQAHSADSWEDTPFFAREFRVVAERNEVEIADLILQNPAIITIEYGDADVVYRKGADTQEPGPAIRTVKHVAIDEDEVMLYSYDEAMHRWQQGDVTLLERDVAANQLRVLVTEPGKYGLFAATPPDIRVIYLPLLMKE